MRPLSTLLVLAGFLAGCAKPTVDASRAPSGPARVPVLTVERVDVTDTVTVPATVRAIESADLFAKVGGHVASVDTDIGYQVTRGQVLATLSIPEMHEEFEEARARVEFARARVAQARAAVTEADAGVAAADAALARVRARRGEFEAEVDLRRTEFARWTDLAGENPSIERRKVDEARYRLAVAEAGLKRLDADRAVGEAARREARARQDRAEADTGAAEANVGVEEASARRIEALLGYGEIRAPFDGTITARHVDAGAFVMPATSNSAAMPLLRIARVDRVRVIADVPMDAVGRIDREDPVALRAILPLPGRSFQGTVTRLAEALDEGSRRMRLEVDFDNPKGADGRRALRPGYYGRLTLTLETFRDAPVVPASAIVVRDDERYVIVVQGGVARERPVETGWQDGERVLIRAGLEGGETVVATGGNRLRDGQPVEPVPAEG